MTQKSLPDKRDKTVPTRRQFIRTASAVSAGVLAGRLCDTAEAKETGPVQHEKAQIAITLDLEMSRNFPNWEDLHWDYEKGNLNQAAKDYTGKVCRRVQARGGIVHNFVVGRVFEQANVDWLKEIAAAGHPIGNHTYDHVYVLAKSVEELQYRFRRSPWLLRGRSVSEVIRDNIKLTDRALQLEIGIKSNGFRTPGGFNMGLAGHVEIQELLLELGYRWVSSKYPRHSGMEKLHGTSRAPSQEAFDSIVRAQRAAQPFVYPTGLVEIPMSPLSDIVAFRTGRWKMKHFLHAIERSLQWVIENRAVFDFLAHPSCLGVVDEKCQAIDLICDMVDQANGAAEIVGLDAIATGTQAS